MLRFWIKGCFIIYFFIATIILSYKDAKGGMSSDLSNKISTYGACFLSAASTYGVSYELLMAIAKVESRFNPRALGRNKNGSYDIGIMQINSSWLPYLRRYGVRIEHLWDPCYNIHIGAMVLRHCMDIYGNSWRAVDCYNKGPKRAKDSSKYVWDVYKALRVVSESGKFLVSFNSGHSSYQTTHIFE
ncbi:MAG: lytic transglycosylase domain-containing protein [Thermofilaceae archaeon]